jgi:rhamnogalacturonyl hydrolase YesR
LVDAQAPSTGPGAVPSSRAEITAAMDRMASAQLALYGENPPADWVAGAFYVGLARLSHLSGDARFLDAERKVAERHNWEFKPSRAAPGIAHADNECIGQMYIDLAVQLKDPAKLAGIRRQWDEVIAGFDHPTPENQQAWRSRSAPGSENLPWWWCDAFFMAPPGLTRLSAVTGDRKYIDAMDKQWWATAAKLYDPEEHLFYRDARFLTQKTPSGKKVFWGRGNGWVVAGLANVLTYMPPDYPSRPRYEKLFKEMCAKLLAVQQPDGLWRASLIDAESAPYPETSGTAFYCYAFAWGINHGLLERAAYEPAARNAWAALNARLRPDGLLGWVQRVGDRPDSTEASSTQPYAVGGYLLSGAEMIDLDEPRK